MEETRLQRDRQILSHIFPEVVWLFIYRHLVRAPKAVEIMFHSSVFFRYLLYSQRNKFLFSRVLHQVNTFIKEATTKCLKTPIPADPVLLKMRMVCTSWCQTVDSKMRFMLHHCKKSSFSNIAIKSLDPDEETVFMSHFKESHSKTGRSPFLGNAATLSFKCADVPENAEPHNILGTLPFHQILSIYGHHVQYGDIVFSCDSAPKPWFEVSVLRAISNMPNLKYLTFDLNWDLLLNNSNGWHDVPLPQFKHLLDVFLTIKPSSEELTTKLLSKMPYLEDLLIIYTEELYPSQNLIPGVNLPKLRNLNFILTGRNFHWTQVPEFAENHPTLQQHDCLIDAGLHAFFRTLETHSPFQHLCKIQLYLGCTVPSSWQEWKNYKVDLPNLTDFVLGSWTWISIDMILLFSKTLEELTIQLDTGETWEEFSLMEVPQEIKDNEEIKFLSCYGVLSKENKIWVQMPKLKKVIMKILGEVIFETISYPDGHRESSSRISL